MSEVIGRLAAGSSLLFDTDVSIADAIVATLEDVGIELVFGIPGGHVGGLFTALHGHRTIRVVQVREESIGSAAAEAYGRLRGKPAVVMGQGQWLSGNAGQGLVEALLGSSPVLVLTEMTEGGVLSHHGPYQSGSGDYGAWDARGAFGSICKRVFVSLNPAQAVQHTQLAFKHAVTGEPGPVAVVYHSDATTGTVGPNSHPRLFRSTAYIPSRAGAFDADAIRKAVDALCRAQRPVIIAGNGVRVGQACDALIRLARTLDAPVATSASGKGVFPEEDALAAGVIGTFGNSQANALVAGADLVFAVGTKLGPIDTADENPALIDALRQVVIHVDVEPLNIGWTTPVDHALVGDAATVLERIIDALEQEPTQGRARGAARISEATAECGVAPSERSQSDAVPMYPERVIAALRELWPADGIVTVDAGENRLFMMQWYRQKLPGGYLQPAAGGGMGYAIPAALGAKLAFPDRPVLAVCGDGGFAMAMASLMTAVQEKIQIAVVVFNNNALGWVLHGMGEKAVAADFDEFDHAAIAQSMGCNGLRASPASTN